MESARQVVELTTGMVQTRASLQSPGNVRALDLWHWGAAVSARRAASVPKGFSANGRGTPPGGIHLPGQATSRVLVIDDDEAAARLASMTMELEGYEVFVASDGEAGLALARELRPRLVLLDMMMPGISGLEVCTALREDPTTATTTILFLTARTLPADRLAAAVSGADDYITKPFDLEELRVRATAALRRADALRDVSPLTRLPGNNQILARLGVQLSESPQRFALIHADLDNFKAYNDRYGFVRGDEAICATADVLARAIGAHATSPRFLGHVGGDDFAMIAAPESAEALADAVVAAFDSRSPAMHTRADRQRGFITTTGRDGTDRRHPLLSLSLGIATTAVRQFSSVHEIAAVASEVKTKAKGEPGSTWRIDRRGVNSKLRR